MRVLIFGEVVKIRKSQSQPYYYRLAISNFIKDNSAFNKANLKDAILPLYNIVEDKKPKKITKTSKPNYKIINTVFITPEIKSSKKGGVSSFSPLPSSKIKKGVKK